MICGLVKKGHEVHLIAPRDRQFLELSSHFATPLHDLPLSPRSMNFLREIRTLLCLFKIVRSVSPDVMINFTIKCVIYGSLAAAWGRVKNIYSVMTGLGSIFSKNSLGHFFKKILVRLLYKKALAKNKRVFFQNREDRQLFQEWNLITPNQGEVVNGSGVDLEYFSKADNGPLPNPNSFIMVARLLQDKGVREFVRAAEKIKCDYPGAVFSLMGSPEVGPTAISQEELKGWINSKIINYIPHSPEVKEQLEKHQVFVLPSYYREGVPRSLLEAMSMGMPVITTLTPGCRETVREGENGYLIPVKNPQILEEKMRGFLDNPSRIGQFGQVGRQICKEKFDVRKINGQMMKGMGL